MCTVGSLMPVGGCVPSLRANTLAPDPDIAVSIREAGHSMSMGTKAHLRARAEQTVTEKTVCQVMMFMRHFAAWAWLMC